MGGNNSPLTGFSYFPSADSATITYQQALVTVSENSEYHYLLVSIYRVVTGTSATIPISSGQYVIIYNPGVDVGIVYLTDENNSIKFCSPIGSSVPNTNYTLGTVRWNGDYDLANIVS